MKKLIVLCLASLIFISSCGKTEAGPEGLTLAVSQDITSLDVQKSTSRCLRDMLVGQVYERLFVPSSDGTPMGELAESWEVGEDGKELHIKLRDVRFSDGSKLEGKDAKASIERWASSYGAARSLMGAFIIEDEEDAITIKSDSNLSLLPYMMASSPQSPVMMPAEKATEENRFGHVESVIGTGPYEVESFESGSMLRLVKRDDYEQYSTESDGLWGRKDADYPFIEYRIVPESVTRRIGLERGEYDYMNEVMSEDMEALSENEDIRLVGREESGSIALVFNKKSELGSDREFRRAVSLALDKDALMKACYGEFGYNLHSDYMEGSQSMFSCSGDPYFEMDASKSREYLERSSYDGRPFRILTSNLSNMEKIALAAKEYLERVGIKTEVTVLDWTGFLASRKDSTGYDMFVSAFTTVALPQMKLYLSADYPGWYEDQNNELIMKELNDAESLERAAEVWQEGQEYYWSEVPVIVPGHYVTINAVRSDIEGVVNQDGTHFFRSHRAE